MQHMTFSSAGGVTGSRPSAIACCRLLWLNPISLAVSFLVAVIVGTALGAVAAVVTIAVAGVLLAAASPLPLTRRLAAPALARKERRERNEARERRLVQAGSARRIELDELCGLVEEIAERDPDSCARLELDELVDMYVDIVVLAESYRGAARRAIGLVGDGEGRLRAPVSGGGGRLRSDLVRRRIAHRDQCTGKVEELEAELDAVIELVRLVAQRTVCPLGGEHAFEPQLQRRLWELDTRESAIRQLAGEPEEPAAQ